MWNNGSLCTQRARCVLNANPLINRLDCCNSGDGRFSSKTNPPWSWSKSRHKKTPPEMGGGLSGRHVKGLDFDGLGHGAILGFLVRFRS